LTTTKTRSKLSGKKELRRQVMLIPSLIVTKSRGARVRAAYRKYLDATHDFMTFAQQRALAATSDLSGEVTRCFELQHRLHEQRVIRFNFLFKSKSLDCAAFKTLEALSDRLDKNWSEEEEGVILLIVEAQELAAHARGISTPQRITGATWPSDPNDAPSANAPPKANPMKRDKSP
jgi:hypothetical protein